MMFNLQTPITMKLLLLVFPLIWFEVTFGVRSEPDVIRVEEGSDVILPCSLNSTENIVSKRFEWKKDDQKTVFIYDSGIHSGSGRVSHFDDKLKSGNASIIIRNTTVADSGNYTCDFPQLQPRQIFHIKLRVVAAAPKPYVKTLNQTQYWALLLCEVRGAFPKPELHWQDSDGNILHAEEPKVTERRGRYNVILQTIVTKTDIYRCVATQEEISHQIYAEIHVNISGAVPEPYVTSLDVTKNSALLQCKVQGAFPKPKLHWEDRAGNILHAEEPKVTERGGRYHVILNITVTKTDDYSCVATQEEIRHQIYSETHVFISGSSAGWVVAAVFVTLVLGIIVLAVLKWKGCIILKCNTDRSAAV